MVTVASFVCPTGSMCLVFTCLLIASLASGEVPRASESLTFDKVGDDAADKRAEVVIDINKLDQTVAQPSSLQRLLFGIGPDIKPDTKSAQTGGVDHGELLKSKRAKSNKIGFMLSKLHQTSEMLNLRESKKDLENHETFEDMTVEALLIELCPPSLGLCTKWVNSKSQQNSDLLEKLAAKIRARPRGVDPRRYLWHLLVETGAGSLVERNYDRHIDGLINFVGGRNIPATIVPLVATDMYLKLKYDTK